MNNEITINQKKEIDRNIIIIEDFTIQKTFGEGARNDLTLWVAGLGWVTMKQLEKIVRGAI